jgi:hypothetical protein
MEHGGSYLTYQTNSLCSVTRESFDRNYVQRKNESPLTRKLG